MTERRLKQWIMVAVMFLIQGCSLENLFITKDIDKVYVVKYTTYVKHHKAYFARESLRPLENGKKYLFLYHPKKHDLGLLLHKRDTYLLYSFTTPDRAPLIYHPSKRDATKYAIRHFLKMGYKKTDIHKLGYVVSTGLRLYKGTKTLMVEVKDYSRLLRLYREAIDNYDARAVLPIDEKLPPSLIENYLVSHYRQAASGEARAQLLRIARKLGITIPHAIPLEDAMVGKNETKSYYYYLYFAPTDELEAYIEENSDRTALSKKQLHDLKERFEEIKLKKLLSDGSMDELIEAYKRQKDPRIKERIMELIKEQQEK